MLYFTEKGDTSHSRHSGRYRSNCNTSVIMIAAQERMSYDAMPSISYKCLYNLIYTIVQLTCVDNGEMFSELMSCVYIIYPPIVKETKMGEKGQESFLVFVFFADILLDPGNHEFNFQAKTGITEGA